MKRMQKLGPVVTGAVLMGMLIAGCAHARHVAVVLDASFAEAVFALDDAERKGCQTAALTPAQCAAADPKIKQALIDVKAITESLQKTPKDVAIPKNLPDLLTNLTQVQAILGPTSQIPQAADVSVKAQKAIDQAIAVLKLLAVN